MTKTKATKPKAATYVVAASAFITYVAFASWVLMIVAGNLGADLSFSSSVVTALLGRFLVVVLFHPLEALEALDAHVQRAKRQRKFRAATEAAQRRTS